MVKLIAAVGPNNLIGIDDKMAWHIREEFDHFRKTTSGHSLLFGARTFLGLPSKLAKRFHYVLDYEDVPGADKTLKSFQEVESLIAEFKEKPNEILFIAGGKSIFEKFYKLADELIISEVKTNAKGNVFIEWDLSSFNKKLVSQHKRFTVYSYTKKDD